MDRNTVIGVVLIFLLFIVWQQIVGPSEAQLAEERRVRDSIAMESRKADSLAQLALDSPTQTSANDFSEVEGLPDSLAMLQLGQTFGPFAESARGEEKEIVLENDLSKVYFSTKGGNITLC